MSAERKIQLTNDYRYMNFDKRYGPGFRLANVPKDLCNIFADGQGLPTWSRWRQYIPLDVPATDTHPLIKLDIHKMRFQSWKASIAEDMGHPGAPVAAVTMMMYYRKHGYNETRAGAFPGIIDLRLLRDSPDSSEWPLALRDNGAEHPVIAHLKEGRGYLATIDNALDQPQETDFPKALHNLAQEYNRVYEEGTGEIEVARMIGASSLETFTAAWRYAETLETPVFAARALLRSGTFDTGYDSPGLRP